MLRLRNQAVHRLGTPYTCPSCLAATSRPLGASGLLSSIAVRQRIHERKRAFTSSAARAAKPIKKKKNLTKKKAVALKKATLEEAALIEAALNDIALKDALKNVASRDVSLRRQRTQELSQKDVSPEDPSSGEGRSKLGRSIRDLRKSRLPRSLRLKESPLAPSRPINMMPKVLEPPNDTTPPLAIRKHAAVPLLPVLKTKPLTTPNDITPHPTIRKRAVPPLSEPELKGMTPSTVKDTKKQYKVLQNVLSPSKKKKPFLTVEDTTRHFTILQGALAALKNVLDEQNIKVDNIKKPKREAPHAALEVNGLGSISEDTHKIHADAVSPTKGKPKPKKPTDDKPINDKLVADDRRELNKLRSELKKVSKTPLKHIPSLGIAPIKRPQKTRVAQVGSPIPIGESAGKFCTDEEPLLHIPKLSPGEPSLQISKLSPEELELVPIEKLQPPVATLAHGLERALFNPGVYDLQDPRSKVYNFDPYLANIMPIKDFDFNALQSYVTSSKDTSLIGVARENQKKYTGSTSSMTSMLSHFHYLLSGWREINSEMMSKDFEIPSKQFTRILRAPAATFLHWKDGVYAIDADKEFDSASVLSMLGKSMEKLLTLPVEKYERYRRGNSHQISEEERNAPEAFHYTGLGDFMMRSQLDAYDPRVPGTGMFDIKTRSVVSIRMDAKGYEKGLGYEIRSRLGNWESYEREYHDMIRSAFLKYSLQVRMGRMDGIFVAFHNTQRIFGFQYIPVDEMDLTLHGTSNRTLGDKEFKLSLGLLNKLLNRATEKFPKKSLRLFIEARTSRNLPFLYAFVKPVETHQINAIQDAGKAQVEEFEKNMLGLQKSPASESTVEAETNDGKTTVDEESVEGMSASQDAAEVEEGDETTASWDEIQMMVEDAMEDEEFGVGAVRQAIEDALEESGLLEEQSAEGTRDYVDALLSAVTGSSAQVPSGAADTTTDSLEADVESTVDTTTYSEIEISETATTGQEEGRISSKSDDESAQTTDGSQVSEVSSMPSEYSLAEDESLRIESQSQEESELGEDDALDDTVTSPSMPTLRNAILRMTRRLDVGGLAEEQRDEAVSSKLQEFERLLGKIISESREDEQEAGDPDITDMIPATEGVSKPTEEAATPPSSPSAAADTTASTKPTSTEEVVESKGEKGQPSPILGMVLTIRNKVNDKFVDRPERLTKDDTWEVEYNIEELPDDRARRIFGMCAKRRAVAYGKGGKRPGSAWNEMFEGALRKYTSEGRQFRQQENERAKDQPVEQFGAQPKSYQEVFGVQEKH